MKIALFQYDIVWKDKEDNLRKLETQLKNGIDADLLILPEMFSTGFCMEPESLAEGNEGNTMSFLRCLSERYQTALCGSFVAEEGGKYYNRAFFVMPSGKIFYYDKRHLFLMGQEGDRYTAGDKRIIVNYKGWNICLMICFDLRFPVWSRNVDNAYDLLIYVANWPTSRISSWNALLPARGIENLAYVCGVNRVGTDGMNNEHNGDSSVYDYKGKQLLRLENGEEHVAVVDLSKEKLDEFRKKFPVFCSADRFEIK